ncbi:MAG: HNH endonuclease [Armatimonadetes bacterium]|nr:HNH endonuclease [Armatimonadota bacterium]
MPARGITQRQKQSVTERAGNQCEYCRSPGRVGTHPFSVEHITPRQKGGTSTLDNLALSCQGCNNHKHTKVEANDPDTGQTVPLYHPRRHRWRDHFCWSEDLTTIVGLTPTGRATVEALHLNREMVVNFRRLLIQLGQHPPEEADE